ncbi:MAG: FAD-dependent oxidoreductase, partial [Clostridiales bacterium]|nr:FAD-dependent oxidoreductase [Clostridiales bacterium]
MEQNVIVLGGGYAGVLTAKKLAKRFVKHHDVKITLIDKNRHHTMLTELHEVAAHRVEEANIKISLNRIFAGRKVKLILDNIVSVDYDHNTLIGREVSYQYDYLVLAAGSQPAFFGIPGADKFAFGLWSYEDAVRIKEHVLDMFRLASKETDADTKRKLLTFYVVGAGFTGVEMAGELAEWTRILCDEFEIERERIEIVN